MQTFLRREHENLNENEPAKDKKGLKFFLLSSSTKKVVTLEKEIRNFRGHKRKLTFEKEKAVVLKPAFATRPSISRRAGTCSSGPSNER